MPTRVRQMMLARMQSLLGPFPKRVLDAGRDVAKYVAASSLASVAAAIPVASTVVPPAASLAHAALVFERPPLDDDGAATASGDGVPREVLLLAPQRSCLRVRLGAADAVFLDFLASLLALDPDERPSAAQALRHPWLTGPPLTVEPYALPQ